MQRLRGFPRRFRFPWRTAAEIRRDVEDELAFHLAAKTEALQKAGSSLEEARELALSEFGDLETARARLVAEGLRAERLTHRLRTVDDLWRDVRIAARSLRRTPAFTVVAVLVLALGIGVVSGAFHLVDLFAFKPALIEQRDQALSVYSVHSERRNGRLFSYPEYLELRERIETFSSLAAHALGDVGIEEGGETRKRQAAFISADYFDALGVPPARGRGFTRAEERGEEPATVVVSHDFWLRNGADPNLLGSVIRVNRDPLVVVGIAARGFTGTMALSGPDVWLPLAASERIGIFGAAPANLRDRENRSLFLFGRLADGASAEEAGAELAALAASTDANLPDASGGRYTYVAGRMARSSMSDAPNPDDGAPQEAFLPLAMSSVVLLIACLNLANMFLARGASRRTEMAIRQSLGSGRLRLVRQILVEGMLLALLGGAAGLIWTYWATSWIAASLNRIAPLGLSLGVDTRPDLRVLLVTAATCVAATLLFGLGPAWRVTGADVLTGLKEVAGAVPFGRRRTRTVLSGRGLLMIAQIALSLAMLTAGGLFLRSSFAAANATPSFSLDSTLLVELDASLVGNDEPRSRALYVQAIERLRALPGVEHAGTTSLVPFTGRTIDTWVRPAGLPPDRNAFAYYAVVGDGYFDALHVPMLRGRDFTPTETGSNVGPRVAIVAEGLARRLFPDSDPLGRQIQLPSSDAGEEPVAIEIVGIVPGTPAAGFDPAPKSHVYLPFGQAAYMTGMNVLVAVDESVADPSLLLETIRNEIREIDRSLPVLSLMTMREFRDNNWLLWFTRLGGRLVTLLAAAALFMAMVGLYGIMAFLMSRRTREIGVRMALGATRSAVLRQMMRDSLLLTAIGLAVGWPLTLGAGQLLSSLLYGVSATDPWVFAAASALLACAAVFASWLPVRKALRVEPSAALRHE